MKTLLAAVSLTIGEVPDSVNVDALTLDLDNIKDGKIPVHDPESGQTHSCKLVGWTTEYIEEEE